MTKFLQENEMHSWRILLAIEIVSVLNVAKQTVNLAARRQIQEEHGGSLEIDNEQ